MTRDLPWFLIGWTTETDTESTLQPSLPPATVPVHGHGLRSPLRSASACNSYLSPLNLQTFPSVRLFVKMLFYSDRSQRSQSHISYQCPTCFETLQGRCPVGFVAMLYAADEVLG